MPRAEAPAWSPPATRSPMQNNADGTFEIYTIAASATEGTGVRRSPAEIGKQYQNPQLVS